MANLIISIIAIALVAAAALMGAYYGGTAFLNAQIKAKVNEVIGVGEQIIAAWTAYAANNRGNYDIASVSTLIPNFISSSPNFSIDNNGFGWEVIALNGDSIVNSIGVVLWVSDYTADFCIEFTKAFNGANALPTRLPLAGYTGSYYTTSRRGDCLFLDDAVKTIPDTETIEIILYIKAF